MNFNRSNDKSSTCKGILGPTNTGKTYYALERMISYKNGVIGVPLRLLAREIYDRLVSMKGTENVVLNTGEEKIRGKTSDIGFVQLRPCLPIRHLSF